MARWFFAALDLAIDPSPAHFSWRSRVARLLHRRRRRVLAIAAVLLAAMVTVGGLLVMYLSKQRPAGATLLDGRAPEVERTGRAVEDGLATLLSQARPSATPGTAPSAAQSAEEGARWSMVLDEQSANAWLASRLEPWLISRGASAKPRNVRGICVGFADSGVRLMVGLEPPPGGDEPLWITVEVWPQVANGMLYLPLEGVSIGRMPLPVSKKTLVFALAELAEEAKRVGQSTAPQANAPQGPSAAGRILGPAGSKGLAQALDAASRAGIDAVGVLHGSVPAGKAELKLPDGRTVRVEGVVLEPGRMVLQMRTLGARR